MEREREKGPKELRTLGNIVEQSPGLGRMGAFPLMEVLASFLENETLIIRKTLPILPVTA